MGRVGAVQKIAAVVLFFAFNESAYVIGKTLHVTGSSR